MRAGAVLFGSPLDVADPHHFPGTISAFIVLCAVVQCCALALVARARATRSAIATGVVLAAIALTPAALTSADPYAYAGYALLPELRDAYAPPNAPPPAGFGAVATAWGTPLLPCVYGPLFVVVDRAVVAGATGLAGALIRLRLLGLGAWTLLVIVFASSRRTRRFVPLVAANPAIAALYVAGAHNDLAGVGLLAGAALVGPRRPWLAAGLVALACAWKITLTPLAFCVVPQRPRGRAYALALSAAAAGIGLSVLAAGPAYLTALVTVGRETTDGGAIGAAHGFVALAALVALAASAGARVPRWTTWLPMSVGARMYPWYAAWPLPLALRTGTVRAFLVTLPLVAVAVGTFSTIFGYAVIGLLMLAAAVPGTTLRRIARAWR